MAKEVNIRVVGNGFEVVASDAAMSPYEVVFTSWKPLRKFLDDVLGEDGLVQFAVEDVPGARKSQG